VTTAGTGTATDGRAAAALGGEEGRDGAEARADRGAGDGSATGESGTDEKATTGGSTTGGAATDLPAPHARRRAGAAVDPRRADLHRHRPHGWTERRRAGTDGTPGGDERMRAGTAGSAAMGKNWYAALLCCFDSTYNRENEFGAWICRPREGRIHPPGDGAAGTRVAERI